MAPNLRMNRFNDDLRLHIIMCSFYGYKIDSDLMIAAARLGNVPTTKGEEAGETLCSAGQ